MEAWLWSIHPSLKKATAVFLCLVDPQCSLRTLSPHSFYHKIIYILPLILKNQSYLRGWSQSHCQLSARHTFLLFWKPAGNIIGCVFSFHVLHKHPPQQIWPFFMIDQVPPHPYGSAIHLAPSLGTSELPPPPSHGSSVWLTACLGRQKLLLVSDSFSVFTGLGTNLGTQPRAENILTEVNFASVSKPA